MRAWTKRGIAWTLCFLLLSLTPGYAAPGDAAYDARQESLITPVKDQGTDDTSWAFAAISAVETAIVKRGWHTANTLDLSEQHMRYALSADGGNTLGFSRKASLGATRDMVAAYFARGEMSGVVYESADPYRSGVSDRDPSVTGSKPAAFRVTDMVYLPEKISPASHVQNMKNAIAQYGSVVGWIYCTRTYSESWDSEAQTLWRYTGTATPNLCVAFVGWDDEKNAFLVKNSWGDQRHDGGFFYVSYEDTYCGADAYAVAGVERADTFSHIYGYTPLGYTYAHGYTGDASVYAANLFTAAEGEQTLQAVGVHAVRPGAYSIFVADDLEADTPRELVAQGRFAYAGPQTVPISPVDLADQFAVIVEFEGGMNVPMQMPSSGIASLVGPGQSFVSQDGVRWMDFSDSFGAAACITALCRSEDFVPVEQLTLSDSAVTLASRGEIRVLTATVQPEDASRPEVFWQSSDETVATVSSAGLVTAVGSGKTVITASVGGGLLAQCTVEVPPTPLTGLQLSQTVLTMRPNETTTLTPLFTPADTTETGVSWLSGSEEVAVVNETGGVTAIMPGKTTITCIPDQYPELAVSCEVEVVSIPISRLSLRVARQKLAVGSSFSPTAVVLPADATDPGLTWTSSDPLVARVDDNGLVTGISTGEALITVQAPETGLSASCTVSVTNNADYMLAKGRGVTLKMVGAGSADAMSWELSGEDVLSITSAGANARVKTLSEGIGYVTATNTETGATQTWKIHCVIPVRRVSVDTKRLSLVVGGADARLSASVEPEEASVKSVRWTSSKPGVASVDADGTVTPVGVGVTVITCAAVSGGKQTSCRVTVLDKPASITFKPVRNTTLAAGKSAALKAILTPKRGVFTGLQWSSSDESVAVATEKGKVTMVGKGTATITAASAADPAIRAEIRFTGVVPVTKVIVAESKINLSSAGEIGRITASVQPANASEPGLTYTSSNPGVASVDALGRVTAVSRGSTRIIVQTANGKKAYVTVRVKT